MNFDMIRSPGLTRCIICAGLSGHPPIEGDGEPVCYPCLIRCGRAADATTLTVAEAALLAEMHGDIVELKTCAEHEWCWMGFHGWPGVHDETLAS